MREHLCTRCGSIGRTRTETPGSILIEIVAWLAFLLPGLIYSLWRLSARREVCAACGAAETVPVDTPRGRAMAAQLGVAIPPDRARLAGAAAGAIVARWLKHQRAAEQRFTPEWHAREARRRRA